MPIIKSKYKAQFFLKNPHVQTILGFFLSKFRVIASNLASTPLFGKNKIQIKKYRERIFTPDEDFLDLDWITEDHEDDENAEIEDSKQSGTARKRTSSRLRRRNDRSVRVISSDAEDASHVSGSYPSKQKYKLDSSSLHEDHEDDENAEIEDCEQSRLVIICHGLEASSQGAFEQCLAKTLYKEGFDIVLVNYRGCSGEPNKLLKSYHSGKSEDLKSVIDYICAKKKYSHYRDIYLVGNSVGGNIILKYLGEEGFDLPSQIKKAFAISVPLDLASSSRAMARKENALYMSKFLGCLKAKIQDKEELLTREINLKDFSKLKNFYDFDSRYTAPLNDFSSAEDYWIKASSKPYLNKIQIPTYILSSLDDSFLAKDCYPFSEAEHNKFIFLECSSHGGHCGFIELNLRGISYAEQEVVNFLNSD
jgi:predicted alpha/beta-fold hydrolase